MLSLSACVVEQRVEKVFCKLSAKCNVTTAKTRFLKAPATCNRRRIALCIGHV